MAWAWSGSAWAVAVLGLCLASWSVFEWPLVHKKLEAQRWRADYPVFIHDLLQGRQPALLTETPAADWPCVHGQRAWTLNRLRSSLPAVTTKRSRSPQFHYHIDGQPLAQLLPHAASLKGYIEQTLSAGEFFDRLNISSRGSAAARREWHYYYASGPVEQVCRQRELWWELAVNANVLNKLCLSAKGCSIGATR